MYDRAKYKKDRISTTKLIIDIIIHLFTTPNNSVNIMETTSINDEYILFLFEHDLRMLFSPTRSANEAKNDTVESVNRTANFLKFSMNKLIIDRMPAKIPQIPVIPKPIKRSE